MGTIPTQAAFTAGAVLTATQMNQQRLIDAFWANVPRSFAYRSGALNLSNYTSTWTAIDLDAEIYDNPNNYDGGGDSEQHSTSTTPARIFIRTAGKYQMTGAIEFASNSTGFRSAMIRKNSAGSDSGGTLLVTNTQGAVNGAITSVPMPVVEETFSAGDHVELFGRQNSGGSLGVGTGRAQTYMYIWLKSA